MTSTKIPIAGVLGHPIAHSKSPLLHGYWLKKYKKQGYYIPIHVNEQDLPGLLDILPKIGFVGLNVALPYKEIILEFANIISDRAAVVGAANTVLLRKDGQIQVDNTDIAGFRKNIEINAPKWKAHEKPVAVLGAGGAAKAVIFSLIEMGVKEIRIANRSRQRAEECIRIFGRRIIVYDWNESDRLCQGCSMIVNTTPLGMKNQEENNFLINKLPATAYVVDVVYNPLETEFMKRGRLKGHKTVGGIDMLFYQAMPAFNHWFGVMPEIDDTLRNLMIND